MKTHVIQCNGFISPALVFVAFVLAAFAGLAETRVEKLRAKLASGDRNHVFVAMHRGDWRNYPENSKGAIESCIRLGADIVELDVARTKDGRFILNHDGSLDRTTTGKGLVADYTLEELKKLKLRGNQGGQEAVATDYNVLSLEEAIELTRGRILMNIDHFTQYPREILDVVEKCGATKEVLVKATFGYDKSREFFGERHWRKVMSGELLYMPVIRFCWGEHKASATNLSEWIAHEPRPCSMYEMCFDSDEGEAQLKKLDGVAGAPRIWVNTLWDSLDNKRPDTLALKDPDAVWGWCATNRVTMIQTEYGKEALDYLRSRGRHDDL